MSALTQYQWFPTGALLVPRFLHRATLLPSGRVLFSGGMVLGYPTASMEIYDPITGRSIATGNMTMPRASHTATLLPSGKVLLAGGQGGTATAEIYDPATGLSTPTGTMNDDRGFHTATLLPSGRVLLAAGEKVAVEGYLLSAEEYDPGTGVFTPVGNLTQLPRLFLTNAPLLGNGKVLFAGGSSSDGSSPLATAELYDPSSKTFSATGSMHVARNFYSITLMADGKVLAAGCIDGTDTALASAEVYDPTTATWTLIGSMIAARGYHAAVLMAGASILITGGDAGAGGGNATLATVESCDAGVFTSRQHMLTPRYGHTLTLLNDGSVLAAGDASSQNMEIYRMPVPNPTVSDIPSCAGRAGFEQAGF